MEHPTISTANNSQPTNHHQCSTDLQTKQFVTEKIKTKLANQCMIIKPCLCIFVKSEHKQCFLRIYSNN